MPTGSFLDYDAMGIAKLLRTELLAVPMYQRSYSWQTSDSSRDPSDDDSERSSPVRAQVVEYWEDLTQSFADNKPYFLGTVVLSADGADPRRDAAAAGW